MIITDLKQGTPEWLAWRRNHVCASEIPILMGESDFQTPREIWKIKTGRSQEQESNWAMQRGSDTEPKIRALYSLENDIDVSAACAEHPHIPILAASLDGYNGEFDGGNGLIVEIKYPGKEKHELAKSGKLPECYYGQVQFQLEVAQVKYCDYISYNGTEIAVVRVERDRPYIDRMLPVAKAFWEFVLTDTPPPLTDRDFVTLEDQKSVQAFEEWKLAKATEDKKRIESARTLIQSLMSHPRVICSGVKVTTVNRKSGPSLDIRLTEAAS